MQKKLTIYWVGIWSDSFLSRLYIGAGQKKCKETWTWEYNFSSRDDSSSYQQTENEAEGPTEWAYEQIPHGFIWEQMANKVNLRQYRDTCNQTLTYKMMRLNTSSETKCIITSCKHSVMFRVIISQITILIVYPKAK